MAFWSRLRSAVPPRRAVAAASVAAGALTTYSLPNTVFADAMDTSETSVAIHNSNMGKNVLGDKLLRGKTIAEASEELNRARKRVAIFGGSFNPITNAHLNCAAEISAYAYHRARALGASARRARRAAGLPPARTPLILAAAAARSPLEACRRGVDHSVRLSAR